MITAYLFTFHSRGNTVNSISRSSMEASLFISIVSLSQHHNFQQFSFSCYYIKYDRQSNTMFIPKENRIAVFSYLFKEGVCVVKKDNRSATHPHIEGPSNLEVLCLMKSLESRGLIRITFSWQYNYCYLLDEGIEYLRQYLALPAEIVPATHKKQASRPASRDQEEDKFGGEGRPAFRGSGDREYRGREGGGGGGGGFGRGGGI
jgi:small subunit ribosomal protein S10e